MNRPGMGMATVMIKTIIKPASLMVETVVVLMLITSIAQSVNALKKVEGESGETTTHSFLPGNILKN